MVPGSIASNEKLLLPIALALFAATAALAGFTGFQIASLASPASRCEIIGRVRDLKGNPVAGLKISLRNWMGAEIASAVTDERGRYELRDIVAGRYHCNFRPLAEGSDGQTVILDVRAQLMRLNLTVTRNPSPMAAMDGLVRPPV